jgi:serine/threonine-protein kinase ULK/ATG1
MQKEKIGPYKIIRKVGEGAFGIVWLTEHSKDQKEFAIKEISKRRMTKKLMENLVREVHISFNLRHKNIIRCHNTLESKNNYYIIFEYCSGGDLEKFMKDKKRLDLNDALYLMGQIKDAYRYLLSQNILHRDIKLENILLEDESNMCVKLSDFGCSKVDPIGTTICGTPKYMALEVMENDNNYNYKADLWSLGLCFWELIFGLEAFPFSQKSREALRSDIKNYSGNNLRFPKLPRLPEMFYDFFKSILIVSPKLRMDSEDFIKHPIFEYVQTEESMLNSMNGISTNESSKKVISGTNGSSPTEGPEEENKVDEKADTAKQCDKIKKFYTTKILEINLIKATVDTLIEYISSKWDTKFASTYKCLLIILLKKALVKIDISYKSLDSGTNSFKLENFNEFISYPNEYVLLKDELQGMREKIGGTDDKIYSEMIHDCYSEEYLQKINDYLYLGTKSDGKSKFIGNTWKTVYNGYKKFIDDYEQTKFEKVLYRVSIILKGKVLSNLKAFY